jgi:hypothetical protein
MTGLLLSLLLSPSFAQEEEEDDFSFLDEGDKAAAAKAAASIGADDFEVDDEEEFGDWEEAPPEELDPGPAEVKRRSSPTVGQGASALPYSVVGKEPLADNYEPTVIFVDRDAVVIELPVLVARNPSDYAGRSYWLVGEIYADGMKVAETRQQVTKTSIATAGPTLAFVKLLAPVPAESGTLEVRVGQSTSAAGAATPLFQRQVSYQLGG